MCDKPSRTTSESTETSTDTVLTVLSEGTDLISDKPRGLQKPKGVVTEYQSRNFLHTLGVCVNQPIVTVSICIVASTAVSLVVCLIYSSNHHESTEPHHEGNKQTTGLCYNCDHLDVYVNRWSWKGVTRDPSTNTCCFKDKFAVMRTFKFYTDVKVSQVQSGLDTANRDIQNLYDGINRGNGSVPRPMLPPDVRRILTEMTQKKRSILHLKSFQRPVHYPGKSIMWSTSDMMMPVIHGDFKIENKDSQVRVPASGIYTVRVEILFEYRVGANETSKCVELECRLQRHLRNVDEPLKMDQYQRKELFTEDRTQVSAVIDTTAKLNEGEALSVACPNMTVVAVHSGAHRIRIAEQV